jgi:predicted DNA-binding transcriptional regulator AlpA
MENLMTLFAVAVKLGKSRASIYRMLADGRLSPVYKPAHPRTPFFRESDVEALDNPGPRTSAWDAKIHRAARVRDNHKCVICGETWKCSAHHVVPVEQGGKDAEDNIVTLCGGCHNSIHKSGKSLMKKAKRRGTTAIAQWLLMSARIDNA